MLHPDVTTTRARYETAKRKGEVDEAARKAENAKQLLERYMHYFERWDAHQKARNKVRGRGFDAWW